MATTLNLEVGDSLLLSVEVGGSANQYTWIRGEDEVVGEEMIYSSDSVTVKDAGSYRLLVQNALVPGLDIFSEIFEVMIEGVTSVLDPAYFGNIKVIGNPVSTNLRILTEKNVDEIFMFNSVGQQVSYELPNSNSKEISMTDYTPGM